MRGFSGAMAGVALAAMVQAAAAEPRAEATGNWAGTAGGGFHFRATLDGAGDSVTLIIRHGIDGVPPAEAAPELVVPGFALSAFATNRLEVVEGPEGGTLQVVTDFADETGEGREVVSLRFIDGRFIVTGYSLRAEHHPGGGGTSPYDCEVDALDGRVSGSGRPRNPPPIMPENAGGWRHDTAFALGWCSIDGPDRG